MEELIEILGSIFLGLIELIAWCLSITIVKIILFLLAITGMIIIALEYFQLITNYL